MYFAEHTRIYPLLHQLQIGIGCPLVAHLGYYFLLACQIGKVAGFVNVVGQRLLYVYVHSPVHGVGRSNGVRMIGRRDRHSINIFFLFEHDSEIGVTLSGWEGLHTTGGGAREIYITQGNYVLAPTNGSMTNIADALATRTNCSQVEPVAGSSVAGATQNIARNNKERSSSSAGLDKIAPSSLGFLFHSVVVQLMIK